MAREIDSFARQVFASCIFSREHLHNLAVCDGDTVVLQKVLYVEKEKNETAADPREQKEIAHPLLVRASVISIHLTDGLGAHAGCGQSWCTISFHRNDEPGVDEGVARAGHAKRSVASDTEPNYVS